MGSISVSTMDIILFAALGFIVPYLLGSCSFAIVVSKLLYHKDIRSFGSGNAGMTNVLRTFGKGAAALTLLGDAGKGAVAVLLVRLLYNPQNPELKIIAVYTAALLAVLGHIFPLYFGFKGGKAVSCTAGCVLAINIWVLIPSLTVFFIVFLISKMVSLGSICAATAYPVFTALYYYFFVGEHTVLATVGASLVWVLIVWMHRTNIKRILSGTEYKFGSKKKNAEAAPAAETASSENK